MKTPNQHETVFSLHRNLEHTPNKLNQSVSHFYYMMKIHLYTLYYGTFFASFNVIFLLNLPIIFLFHLHVQIHSTHK